MNQAKCFYQKALLPLCTLTQWPQKTSILKFRPPRASLLTETKLLPWLLTVSSGVIPGRVDSTRQVRNQKPSDNREKGRWANNRKNALDSKLLSLPDLGGGRGGGVRLREHLRKAEFREGRLLLSTKPLRKPTCERHYKYHVLNYPLLLLA